MDVCGRPLFANPVTYVPYFRNQTLGYVHLVEMLDETYDHATVSELQMHQNNLENEVFKIDVEKLVVSCLKIKEGCIEVTWQLRKEQVHKAYASLMDYHYDLSLLGVKSLVFEGSDQFEDIPYLWYVKCSDVGPIESLPEFIRTDPYPLSHKFQWISLHNIAVAMEFFKGSVKCMNSAISFVTTYPNSRREWKFGIGAANGELVGVVLAYPVCMNIGGVSVTCVSPTICFCDGYHRKELWSTLLKELQRRANCYNVNQFICSGVGLSSALLNPVTIITVWSYVFTRTTNFLLHIYPITPGWRKMTLEDVPSALALVNYYSLSFEIRQVFSSEEEFTHHFICPAVQDYAFTYVVEKEKNKITDLISYHLITKENRKIAHITTVISVKSPVELLLRDVLICAKQNGTDCIRIFQQNISSDTLWSLGFKEYRSVPKPNVYLFNYQYPKTSQENCLYFS